MCVCPHLTASVKVGLMNERIGKSATTTEHLRSSRYWGCRVPHAKHSPRLSVRFTTTGASPTLPIYIVPSAQCRCSFAPRRDPTFVTYSPDTQTFVLHVHSRSHRGATLRLPRIPLILKPLFYTSIPGRASVRPYELHIIDTLTAPQTPNNRISSPLTSYLSPLTSP